MLVSRQYVQVRVTAQPLLTPAYQTKHLKNSHWCQDKESPTKQKLFRLPLLALAQSTAFEETCAWLGYYCPYSEAMAY